MKKLNTGCYLSPTHITISQSSPVSTSPLKTLAFKIYIIPTNKEWKLHTIKSIIFRAATSQYEFCTSKIQFKNQTYYSKFSDQFIRCFPSLRWTRPGHTKHFSWSGKTGKQVILELWCYQRRNFFQNCPRRRLELFQLPYPGSHGSRQTCGHSEKYRPLVP